VLDPRERARTYNLLPKNKTLVLLSNRKPNHKVVIRNLNSNSNRISRTNNSSNKSKEVSRAQFKEVEILQAKRRRRGTNIKKEVKKTNNE
jgi:hypothetical protein